MLHARKLWQTSIPSGGDTNGASRAPSLSNDGRYLAFESDASNSLFRGTTFVYDDPANPQNPATNPPPSGLRQGTFFPKEIERRTLFFDPEGPGFVRLTVIDGVIQET